MRGKLNLLFQMNGCQKEAKKNDKVRFENEIY